VVVENLVAHFHGLQRLLAASVEELRDVEGVGENRARAIRESLSRLAEASLAERY
jgi:diadenylate cyclase